MARLPDSSRMASNDRAPRWKVALNAKMFISTQKKPIPIPLRSLGVTFRQPATRRNCRDRLLQKRSLQRNHHAPLAGPRTYQQGQITRKEQTAPRPQLTGVTLKKTGRPPCSIHFLCHNHPHSGCMTRFDGINTRDDRKETPA